MANISFTIKYWKQNGPKDKGHFDEREMKNIPDDTSFLEMLDMLNEVCRRVTFYSLKCNISEEAAEIAYNTMK